MSKVWPEMTHPEGKPKKKVRPVEKFVDYVEIVVIVGMYTIHLVLHGWFRLLASCMRAMPTLQSVAPLLAIYTRFTRLQEFK